MFPSVLFVYMIQIMRVCVFTKIAAEGLRVLLFHRACKIFRSYLMSSILKLVIRFYVTFYKTCRLYREVNGQVFTVSLCCTLL